MRDAGLLQNVTTADYDLSRALAGVILPAAGGFFECATFGIQGSFQRMYKCYGLREGGYGLSVGFCWSWFVK